MRAALYDRTFIEHQDAIRLLNRRKTMSDDERERMVASIAADSGEVLKRYTDGSGLAFEMSTNLATARK